MGEVSADSKSMRSWRLVKKVLEFPMPASMQSLPSEEAYVQTRKHATLTRTTAQFRRRKVRSRELPGASNRRLGEQIGLVCGVDLVDLEAFAHGLKLGGERFIGRIFTVAERRYCKDRKQKLATRFAA